MRILLLIDSLGPGGAQRQLVGLSIYLKNLGYNVSVVCYHEDPFFKNELLSQGVSYVYLEKAQGILSRIIHIARYIKRIDPKVVISYLETPSICACIAHLFNHRFRLIVSERNTTLH